MSGFTGSGFVDVVEETRIAPTNNGDHDKFAHYVHKDDAMRSTVYGEPVMALCGKIWVIEREGSKFPKCPECVEIFESMFPRDGSDD